MNKSLVSLLSMALFLNGCYYTTSVFIKNQPTERIAYPEWYFTNPQLNLVGKPGDKFKWKLSVRGLKKNTNSIDFAVFCLPLTENTPVTVSVQSKKGYPVIMATDRFIHKDDYYTIMTDINSTKTFPGRPLAYSIGQTNKTTLTINSQFNTLLNIYIWLTDGKMKDIKPDTMPNASAMADSTMNIFSAELIKKLFVIDSINRYNYLVNTWEHSNLNIGNTFGKSEVDVTIDNSNKTDGVPLSDYFFDFYNTKNLKNVFKENQNVNINEIVDWHTITFEYDSLRSKAVGNALTWGKNNVSFKNDLFDLSQETKLENFTKNPVVQAEILKRSYLFNGALDTNKVNDIFISQFIMNGSELAILKSPLSKLLAEHLVTLGGISGAVYDRSGHVIASTSPFIYLNIRSQTEWQKLAKSPGQIVTSGCYTISGFPFALKKVFVPIVEFNSNNTIGWLMAEMYCN